MTNIFEKIALLIGFIVFIILIVSYKSVPIDIRYLYGIGTMSCLISFFYFKKKTGKKGRKI